MMAGGGVYVLLPKWGGVGLYLDGKLDISSPEDERGYDPDITAAEVENDVAENSFILDEGSWRGFNAALMRPISPFLTVYAGAGVARKTVYSLFNVPNDSNVGVGGVVWAEDPEREETGVNLMGGFMMRMTSRFTAHFGGETKPGGFTAGLSLRLPPW
jgi:hypothetical protein